MKDVAKTMDLPQETIEGLNPELRYKVTPPNSYELKVPKERGQDSSGKTGPNPGLFAPQEAICLSSGSPRRDPGKLAARYRTSVRAIASANRIRTNSVIRVGQKLKIPVRGSKPVYVAKKKTSSVDKSKPVRYRVRRGDSLWSVARKHNTNIKEITRANRLKTTSLRVGQVLVIPRGTATASNGSLTKTYRVKRGDTPFKIAQNHRCS